MGKQIEYYIEYEFFVSIAQRALDLGCKIAKEARNGKVIISDAVDIIPKMNTRIISIFLKQGNSRLSN